MATLHLISNPNALADCLTVAGPQDVMVLIEDGVYALAAMDQAAQAKPTQRFCCIGDDITTRGLPTHASAIDYAQLVELCTAHQPIATWC